MWTLPFFLEKNEEIRGGCPHTDEHTHLNTKVFCSSSNLFDTKMGKPNGKQFTERPNYKNVHFQILWIEGSILLASEICGIEDDNRKKRRREVRVSDFSAPSNSLKESLNAYISERARAIENLWTAKMYLLIWSTLKVKKQTFWAISDFVVYSQRWYCLCCAQILKTVITQ